MLLDIQHDRAGSKVVNERVGTFSTDKKDGVCVIPVKAGRPLTLVYFQDKAIMPEISSNTPTLIFWMHIIITLCILIFLY